MKDDSYPHEPIQILHLEDDELDAGLIQHKLTEEGFACAYELVDRREAYLAKLQDRTYDCILADYTLPSFNALEALALAKEHQPQTPFIILSGTIGEDFAIESMRAGATDYVLKERLNRLGPAIRRALKEAQLERKRIESEIRYKSVINAMAEGVLLRNRNGTIIACNPSAERILECPASEINGKTSLGDQWRIVQEDGTPFPPEAHPGFQTLRTGTSCTEVVMGIYKSPDRITWLSVNSEPIIQPGSRPPHAVVSSFTDITQQKESEHAIMRLNKELEQRVVERTKALRESEEKYRLISENSSDLICMCDLHCQITYASPSSMELLGYAPEDLQGTPFPELTHPGDQALIQDFQVTLSKERSTCRLQHRIRRKDGSYLWVETLASPLHEDSAEDMAIQTSTRDISQAKKAEARMERALKKERALNELKSRFVSIASHEFRTPLAVIQTNTELAVRHVEHLAPRKSLASFYKATQRIREEIERLTAMMDDILILGKIDAKHTPFSPQRVEVVTFCQQLIQAYFSAQPDQREVVFAVEGAERSLKFDPKLMEHALLNVLGNAFKYSQGRPAPRFTLRFEPQHVDFEVQDFGIGIPEEERSHIFQSFHRATNAMDLDIQGTGLGLVIVREFVRMHQGDVRVKSTLDEGSTFTIRLPG